MATPTKFLGAITVSSWSFDIDSGGAPETVTLTDGTYYLSDDATGSDFIKMLEDKLNAATLMVDTATVAIDSDGLISISVSANVYTITWTTSGTVLRDLLRYGTGDDVEITSTPTVSDRACQYFAHSTTATNRDIPTIIKRTSLSEADDGTITGVDAGPTVVQYEVKVRYPGGHRSTTANGYHEFRDFFQDVMGAGGKFRWYPDTSVTSAWVDITNPTGYHVVRALSPRTFTPAEVIRDYYGWYTTTFVLQVQPGG